VRVIDPLDPGAAERDLGILLGVEEVVRAQVGVAVGDVGVDAGDINGCRGGGVAGGDALRRVG